MKFSVQQIFQRYFPRHARSFHLAPEMWRAANAITGCRTGRLGMHRIRCVEGHELSLSYNSCRHRFCNNCAALSREKWLSGWSQRLLDCPHHHVVFTVPQPLNRLWRYNRRRFSEALFCSGIAVVVNAPG